MHCWHLFTHVTLWLLSDWTLYHGYCVTRCITLPWCSIIKKFWSLQASLSYTLSEQSNSLGLSLQWHFFEQMVPCCFFPFMLLDLYCNNLIMSESMLLGSALLHMWVTQLTSGIGIQGQWTAATYFLVSFHCIFAVIVRFNGMVHSCENFLSHG
jgi:hypothetical protein